MQVLRSADMEGIAGVVHSDDVIPGHADYERNRSLFTAEVNAAIRGVHAFQSAWPIGKPSARCAWTARCAWRSRCTGRE
jgi:hypothetical protein